MFVSGCAMPTLPRITNAAKRYYSATEVAQLLGISYYTLDNWIASGALPPPVRPGGPRGKRLWPIEQIEQHLAAMNAGPPASIG
jgi:excisionase family DNA binding protein